MVTVITIITTALLSFIKEVARNTPFLLLLLYNLVCTLLLLFQIVTTVITQ